MKKLIKSKTAIAVLTAEKAKPESLAVLSYSVGEINIADNGRVQLLPDGYFSAKDGRPDDVPNGKWLMDELAFANLKNSASHRKNDFHLDYEHQTLNSEDNGKPAPAAGWFKDFEYVPGEGLFATRVDWTPPAETSLKNKEYRYTSAVFSYDPTTGRPVALMHAALTNDPALDGMKAIVALKAKPNLTTNPSGEKPMEALAILLGLLGVAEEGEDLTNAVALKAAQERATTAIAALKNKANRTGTAETELATAQATVVALKAKGGEVDLSKFVPKETYDANLLELASLKSDGDKNNIKQLLNDNADKVLASEITYLTDFGKQQGFAALKSMITARPAIVALKQSQTKGKEKPEDKSTGELTADQIAVCKNMNISQEKFKEQLALGSK